jgi:hypothetical protein
MGAWAVMVATTATTTTTTTVQTTTTVGPGTTEGTQTPLWIQAAPAFVGVLALLGAIYVAYLNSRAEHRRWLRQERLKAYSEFVDIANSGIDDIYEMLRTYTEEGKGSSRAIVLRADDTSYKVRHAMGNISLLGPKNIADAALSVALSFYWSAYATADLLKESDLTEGPDNTKRIDVALFESRLESRLAELLERSREKLRNFRELAARELQDQRRWRTIRPRQ